ncbi:undecaprenyl-phosphate glucose phosphotransferase [Paraburkholderia acidipaludis]|uniref:undecaprenyl-phosphate glucose phosphotransferase n=1 Tax=Paraburkholderia acidipaludis TaxID=660537 RepID=UPI0005BDEB35|nr:undecaprenyl-phosphate glucose phosphotransferase [Paraburkholderia acidipaludis]
MHLPAHRDAGAPRGRSGTLARLLDIVVIALGASVALRLEANVGQPGYDSALIAFALLTSAFLFPVFGLYRIARRQVFWRCVCMPALAWIMVLAVAMLLVIILLDPYRPAGSWFARWALISGLGLVICRFFERWLSLRRTDQGARTRAVAIVGSGAHCGHLLRKVGSAPDSAYLVSTIFDTGLEAGAAPGTIPAFRDRFGFVEYVRRYQVEELWLALPLTEQQTILEFIALFRNDLINIRFIPDVRGLALFEGEMVDLDGTSAINLVGSPLSSDALLAKNIFDRAFALMVLFAISPLLLIIAIAVKISSHGPVLFTQKRKGANGKVFEIYKFRSMRVHETAHGVVKQATRNDPRITRVGAFLRRTSLDELPQFFNVLRGEMSVVGPRPHAIEHDTLYQDIVEGYIHRYRIKPGITGWAQVNGFRGETDRVEKMQGRVEHDLYYLSNWSFGLDMRIVIATVFKGLIHRNAY